MIEEVCASTNGEDGFASLCKKEVEKVRKREAKTFAFDHSIYEYDFVATPTQHSGRRQRECLRTLCFSGGLLKSWHLSFKLSKSSIVLDPLMSDLVFLI